MSQRSPAWWETFSLPSLLQGLQGLSSSPCCSDSTYVILDASFQLLPGLEEERLLSPGEKWSQESATSQDCGAYTSSAPRIMGFC